MSMQLGGKIKYVGIELMRADAKSTDTPETGLFRGIRTRTDGDVTLTLILLGHKDKPDNIRGLNAAVFNLMTLMFMYGQTKEMIVFKNDDADQLQGVELMGAVIEQLKEDKLMLVNDPEIVDVSKYEEVPTEFFSPKTDNKTNGVGSGVYSKTGGTGTSPTNWQKKQEEEKIEKERQEKMRWTPFKLERKGDLPALKDLNIIKKKVLMLAAGEYEKELPPIPGDEDEEEEVKKTGKAAG